MNVAIGTVLTLGLVAALGWWLGTLIAVWNTRPVSMYDVKLERWRAHSLLGTKWRSKRHGPKPGIPLERRKPLEQAAWNDPLLTLEHPVLEQHLDKPA
jgi:hypothetical protein